MDFELQSQSVAYVMCRFVSVARLTGNYKTVIPGHHLNGVTKKVVGDSLLLCYEVNTRRLFFPSCGVFFVEFKRVFLTHLRSPVHGELFRPMREKEVRDGKIDYEHWTSPPHLNPLRSARIKRKTSSVTRNNPLI